MFPRLKKTIALALFLLAGLAVSGGVSHVNAAGGALDTTFAGAGANNFVYSVSVQPDGKILVGGAFTSYNGVARSGVVRVNPNGSLDAGFTPSTITTNTWPGSSVLAMALQADGKIIIAGSFDTYNDTPCGKIARLNPDGSLDTTFDPGTGASDTIFGVAVQGDGKVIIVGNFTSYDGTARNHVARVNADGSLDTSFNPGIGPAGGITAVALQPDGKVLIGGFLQYFDGTTHENLARLNTNGSVDTTFNPGAGTDESIREIALQPDGKIIIAGYFKHYNGVSRSGIARVNTNGSLDATFNPGTGFDLGVEALALQKDGKILAGGGFKNYNGTARRFFALLKSNGELDTTFVPGNLTSPIAGEASVHTIAVQPDGRILVGGYFTTYNGVARGDIARLMPAGAGQLSFAATNFTAGEGAGAASVTLKREGGTDNRVVARIKVAPGTATAADYSLPAPGWRDASFDTGTGPDNIVFAVAAQSDGKVIIGGQFDHYRNTPRNHIARLNRDGTLDTTFNPGSGANGPVMALAVQPNGRIIIGGYFFFYNGTARNFIARVNANGTVDTSFKGSTLVNSSFNSMVLQPDGKILVAGDFHDGSGNLNPRVMRLNSNGSLDPTFKLGAGADGSVPSSVTSAALLPDGKILVAGNFTTYNGVPADGVVRLNADGTHDPTFDSGAGPDGEVTSLLVQENGRAVIAGYFNNYDGTPRHRIARLNTNGTLDTTFNPGTGPNLYVYELALQPDGKLIIGGNFTTYDGVPRERLARLNANGAPDPAFDPGAGASSSVLAMAVRGDGKIVIGGEFGEYRGQCNYVALVEGDLFVTWDAGDGADKTFSLPVVDDAADEADETVKLSLTPVSGGATAGANPAATLTIVDNDPAPTVSVNDVSVSEGGSATFTVKLSAASSRTVTVKFATANGTATAPADYAARALTTLTFAPGETTKNVSVNIAGDLLNEASETFKLVLSSPTNATVGVGTGTCTITDNDPAPSITITNATVTEPDSGTVNAVFTVKLSAPSGQNVKVNFQTANGTALAPGDYSARALTTLTFSPGQTTKAVSVSVRGDLIKEANETFFVNLSAPVNATIADAQGQGTITSDD